MGDYMKPLIGIIMRNDISKAKHEIGIVYKDIIKAIRTSGGIPLGICCENFYDYLDICQGFILEGGSDFEVENFRIITSLKDKDIPLLGICLGMQEMAYNSNGLIKDIPNHLNRRHKVLIKKDSLLYKILRKKKITVNSRHRSAIMKTNLMISAVAMDNIIEAVEGMNTFFLGLQWHPESTYSMDVNSRKIFDYFVKVCHDRIRH